MHFEYTLRILIARISNRFYCSFPLLFLMLGLLGLSYNSAASQATDSSGNFKWQTVKIGAGGLVDGMTVSPSDETGIYVRTDVGNAYWFNGDNWVPLRVHNSDGSGVTSYNDYGSPATQGIMSIAVDPQNGANVYMAFPTGHSADAGGSSGVNVYHSTDHGANFYAGDLNVNGNPNYQYDPTRYGGERLAVDPHNGQIVYYGSTDAGLWVSTNGGANFTQVNGGNAPSTSSNVLNVLFDGGGGVTSSGGTATIYAVVYNGDIFQSTNGGQNWNPITSGTGLSGRAYFTTIDKQGQLYASTYGNDYYFYSTGQWNDVAIGGLGNLINVVADPTNDPADSSTARLFAVSSCGEIFRSNDNGADWSDLGRYQFANTSGWLPQTVGIPQYPCRTNGGLRFDAANNLWAIEGNEGALEYTPPARGSDTSNPPLWTIKSTGIEEFVATQVLVPKGSGDTVIAMVEDGTGFVIKNPDDPNTVTQIPLQQTLISDGIGAAYSPNDPNYVAVSTSNLYSNGPNYSGYTTSLGQSWSAFSGVLLSDQSGNQIQAGPIAVSAEGNSPDGDTVTQSSQHLVVSPFMNKIPEWSHDGGATWNQTGSFPSLSSDYSTLDGYQTIGNEGQHPLQLIADPFTPDLFYLKFLAGKDASVDFYTSTNGGKDWVGQDAGLPYATTHGILAANYKDPNDLWFVDGWEGAIPNRTSGGNAHGLWHCVHDPNTNVYQFNYVSGFAHAIQVALGAQTPGGNADYTLYVYGQLSDYSAYGVFRSTDGGATFDRISYYPAGIYDWPTTMTASWDNPGKVYIGFSGNSFVYSQPN